MTESRQEKEIRQQVKRWKEKAVAVDKILAEETNKGFNFESRFTRDFFNLLLVEYSDKLGNLTKWLIGLTIALLIVGTASLVMGIMILFRN
jgi:hypothetical protein